MAKRKSVFLSINDGEDVLFHGTPEKALATYGPKAVITRNYDKSEYTGKQPADIAKERSAAKPSDAKVTEPPKKDGA